MQMTVSNSKFVFEICVKNVNSPVISPHSIIKSDFTDVFSLILRHFKKLPHSLPPPLLSSCKKKKTSKPYKISEKRKTAMNTTQPCNHSARQTIPSCRSVTFPSSAEFLIQNMRRSPLELSLWPEKENLVYVRSATLPWDAIFFDFLQSVLNHEEPPLEFFNEYSKIVQQGTGEIMAKIELQIKLTYVTNKISTGYIISTEPNARNSFTDVNSKTICCLCDGMRTRQGFMDDCTNSVANVDYKIVSKQYQAFTNEGSICIDQTAKFAEPIYMTPETYSSLGIDCAREIMALCNDDVTIKASEWSRGEHAERVGYNAECSQARMDTHCGCCHQTLSDVRQYKNGAWLKDIPVERVYYVYYFTVEYALDNEPKSKDSSPNSPKSKESSPKEPSSKQSSKASSPSSKASSSKEPPSKGPSSAPPSTKESSSESLDSDTFAKFSHCPPTCPILKIAESAACSKALCRMQTIEAKESVDSKCTSPVCTSKLNFPSSPADSNIVMKFNEIYNPCCVKSCDISERVKDFIASSSVRDESRKKCREMEDAQDPCYCDCVCTFKFSSKTTYCGICGGYECLGDDTRDLPDYARPHPCPVYHKLYDKKYINVKSPWPEEGEKKETPGVKAVVPKAAEKAVTVVKVAKPSAPEKEVKPKETDVQEIKKTKQKSKKEVGGDISQPTQPPEKEKGKVVQKKKKSVNKYAYPAVPGYMGWNWLAKDVPGMEPRQKWRPGAANKILVRKYRALMEGSDTFAKKKRAMMQRKKKIEMKPTLIVSKQGGEFTVQMEVFKKYSKERLLYQYPYDEKPPQIYTIGKTAAEQNKLQRQRDRRARRETRRKSRLLQSTFRDKCQEICLKAYNQAIGLLPLPNPNSPECPCATHDQPPVSPIIDSCSCSDEVTISSSDTDHDEWTIEFTPPMANWDAKAKHPPATANDETQYNYLDYKVKILDRSGNPVPRFFTSHEGKQECSDLGGFWGPGHVWLEINKDGYIGPDERWVPMNFFGPDGMSYSAEEGFFTDNTGQNLKLGIDGYIDKDLKWVWYSKGKKQTKNSLTSTEDKSKCGKFTIEGKCKGKGAAQGAGATSGHAAAGDKGAVEKGRKIGDKKVVLDPVGKHAVSAKKVHLDKPHNTVVMNVSVTRDRNMEPRVQKDRKPFVDPKKISKYREIMAGLQTYDDFCEIQPPAKTNRASNTPAKKPSRPIPQRAVTVESVTNITSLGKTVNNTASLISSKTASFNN